MAFNFSNLKYAYQFLSIYILIYIVFYLCFPNFKKFQNHRNVLFSATLMIVGCTYILFIHPTYFKLGDEIMPKWMAYINYFILHVVPFVLVLYKIRNLQHENENENESNQYNKFGSLIPCLIVGLLYLTFFNLKKIYKISVKDILLIITSSILVFYLIEFFLNQSQSQSRHRQVQ